MRGSPLLRALLALLILLSLGLPLRFLLQADEAPPMSLVDTPVPVSKVAVQPVQVQISFTTLPTRFAVLALGKEVWREEAPVAEMEHELSLAYPKEGVELVFQVAWPAEKPAAARVRVTDPMGTSHEQFIWSEGDTTAVLLFE